MWGNCWYRALALVLLWSPAIWGQDLPLRRLPPAQTGEYSLTGTVVNSVTGEPIPRALVQLPLYPPRVTFSDSGGQFRFDDLPRGQIMVMARKPGFFGFQELRDGRPQGMVKIGPDAASVVVKLVPEGVITGSVTTADGSPLEGIQVSLEQQGIVGGRKQWSPMQGRTTDDEGSFRIAGLQPGRYLVRADAFISHLTRADEVYRRTYYPGVPDRTSATIVDVQPGRTTEADISMQPERGYRVSGTVTGCPGAQGVGIQLLEQSGEVLLIEGMNAAGGTFTAMRVPAGSYILGAQAQAREAREQDVACGGQIPLTVAANLSNVVLPLHRLLPIPIAVRTEFSKPQSPAGGGLVARPVTGGFGSISRQVPQQQVNVHLTGLGSVRAEHYANYEGVRTASGKLRGPELVRSDLPTESAEPVAEPSLTIRGVAPGHYKVELTPNGPWYVESATYGSTDLTREELVISPGERKAIEIVLRDEVASLSGRVRLEEPDARATVLLMPVSSVATPFRTVYIGADGVFHVDGLAPGDYQLLAFERIEDIEYGNPEVMRSYLSKAVRVTLAPNGKATAELDVVKRSEP